MAVFRVLDKKKFLESVEFEFTNQDVKFIRLLKESDVIECKKEVSTRTSQQNRALHKLFNLISEMLNELGFTFNYEGISGNTFEVPYTSLLIKEMMWRPLQVALFNTKSTKELDTQKINRIFEILCNFFADKGHELYFPSKDWQSFEKWYKKNRFKINNATSRQKLL